MGLYSSNMVKSVEEAHTPEVDELFEESMREIEESTIDPDFGTIMEGVLQIYEHDNMMFNALIECDFISVTNEMVMNEADAEEANAAGNTSKVGAIKEKIKKIFTWLGNAIKQLVQNVISKIISLTKTDEKLYNTYKGVLRADKLKGFKGIANFAVPSKIVTTSDISSSFYSGTVTTTTITSAYNKSSESEVREEFAKLNTKLDMRAESLESLRDNYFNKAVDNWTPGAADITNMLNALSGKLIDINSIKKYGATMIKIAKDWANNFDKVSERSAKKNNMDNLEMVKQNELYKTASKFAKVVSKEIKTEMNIAVQQLAAYRKAAILCGRYCVGGDKAADKVADKITKDEEKTKANNMKTADKVQARADKETRKSRQDDLDAVFGEEAIMWAIGESSDDYVYSMFAEVLA